MNYITSKWEGFDVCHYEGSLYNWPCLVNKNGDVVMQLHEGSGDHHYDIPRIIEFNSELAPGDVDEIFDYLKTYCK